MVLIDIECRKHVCIKKGKPGRKRQARNNSPYESPDVVNPVRRQRTVSNSIANIQTF